MGAGPPCKKLKQAQLTLFVKKPEVSLTKLTRQLPLLEDICKGTEIKTVHDVISVLNRDTTRTTCALLYQVAILIRL
jgi:hypothetical protein